ncbi:GNAT family N-acyltransferase [Jannaschia seosinensis]|uniref:GNAT family N-acyltransferase n=1 Tax=Jannaschia seosinensis TaxID=313367 RepID=UPI0006E37FF0|nr:GNAT family N-acyltransferase [Jannaschia seosinensis]
MRLVSGDEAGAAFALRARLFRDGRDDSDAFDADARHLLVERDGLAACARLSVLEGDAILAGYTGNRYDLTRFAARFDRALEVGRICLLPEAADPDLARVMLGAIAHVATATGAAALFGCASFPPNGAGTERLGGYVAPPEWRPGRRDGAVPLPGVPGPLPPMLRGYLTFGAAVSDHAVRDDDLDTLHVFTALPVATIPTARARRLTQLLHPA